MPHDQDGDLYVLISNEEEMQALHEAARLISAYAPNLYYSASCRPGGECTCACRTAMPVASELCPSYACLRVAGPHAFWILSKDAVGHMDVVVCTPHPDRPDRIWCNGNPPAHDIVREDVLPLIQCNFHGQAFPCPRQPGRFLTNLPAFVTGDIQVSHSPEGNPMASYTATCLQRAGWPSVKGCHNQASCEPLTKEFQRDFEYDTPWFPYGPKTGINSSFIYNWVRADETAFLPVNKTGGGKG